MNTVDWTKKDAGFLKEFEISDADVLVSQVSKIWNIPIDQLLGTFEKALETESETANVLNETSFDEIDGLPSHLVGFDSAIKFLLKLFLSVM